MTPEPYVYVDKDGGQILVDFEWRMVTLSNYNDDAEPTMSAYLPTTASGRDALLEAIRNACSIEDEDTTPSFEQESDVTNERGRLIQLLREEGFAGAADFLALPRPKAGEVWLAKNGLAVFIDYMPNTGTNVTGHYLLGVQQVFSLSEFRARLWSPYQVEAEPQPDEFWQTKDGKIVVIMRDDDDGTYDIRTCDGDDKIVTVYREKLIQRLDARP